MAIRSFLAFDLPSPMAASVERISAQLRTTSLPVRWVAPANMHLTVVFLGAVNEEYLGPLCKEVDKVTAGLRAFEISLSSAGFFGTLKNPRVLWLGLKGETERMGELRDSLQASLVPFGIKQEERPFRPHLTLGRFKEGARCGKELSDLIERYKDVAGAPCIMDTLVLYRSDLKSVGPVYSLMHKWCLKF